MTSSHGLMGLASTRPRARLQQAGACCCKVNLTDPRTPPVTAAMDGWWKELFVADKSHVTKKRVQMIIVRIFL